MSEEQYWWCGWEVPGDMPDEAIGVQWPQAMRGWCTGRTAGDATVFAGVVWAASADEARAVVASAYTTHAHMVKERWEPIPKGVDWTPNERFPITEATLLAMKGAAR